MPSASGEDLGERLALEIKVGTRRAHRGDHARTSEQLTNGGELDAGLEQMDGGCVAMGIR